MIARITGTLVHKSPTEIVVDNQGIGFQIHIPVSTFEKLGQPGEKVALFTYLHVREDALLLYGFVTEEERRLFRLLISHPSGRCGNAQQDSRNRQKNRRKARARTQR